MRSVSQYSTLFSCLHDEQESVGNLGGGAHYSVFRAASWLDVQGSRQSRPLIQDFAVIWDEDHDTRIIQAIERIYMDGLLPPVRFIGERKGALNVVIASCDADIYDDDLRTYRTKIQDAIGEIDGDYWTIDMGVYDRNSAESQQPTLGNIIYAKKDVVATYLRNIDNLWTIGTKLYRPSIT